MTELLSPVLILGARSDIARALAHAYAAEGCDLILGARGATDMADDRADLQTRYRGSVTLVEFDVTAADPEPFFDGLGVLPAVVIMVAGLLGEQVDSAASAEIAERVMRTNYNGPALFLLAAARRMEAAGKGTIIGISSVAGERGRASNFIYGSAKAGLTALLSGLRNRLAARGVQVITVKPGFVDTRMTAGMDLPKALTASPKQVADAILRAHRKGGDVVYVKSIWRIVMTVIRSIPEFVFKRLSL